MDPEISVVIPVKNAEGTLEAAIESIFAQEFKNFEIIAVDHSSTDRTPEILSKFSKSTHHFRSFRCEGAFVEAANMAWQKARAPLIARMDADDLARPRRLAEQKKYLDQHPDIVACGTLVHIRKRNQNGDLVPADGGYQRYEEWINTRISPEEISTQRFVDSPLPNPSVMIHRKSLEEIGGYQDPSWAEDYDLWLRMIERGWKLGKVDEVLLDWIDAPSRSTRNIDRYELTQFQRAKAHFLARIPPVREKGVVISGAGPIGKEFARLLLEQGVPVQSFLEVNPRQIGNRIHDVPVLESAEISNCPGNAVVLGAAGQPGARDRIRDLATDAGMIEGRDFFSIA